MVMKQPEALVAAPAVGKAQRRPFSRKRIDTVVSRSVAWFGIVFGLQALPSLLGQYSLGQPLWSALAVGAVYGAMLVALFCSTIKRWVVGSHLLVSSLYVVALLSWPFFLANPDVPQQGDHWLYQLTTVATATAAIGLRLRGALIYLVVVPLIYGIIRATPQGGGGPWELGLFNAVYAIILGGAVLVIVTMTRVAATSVDEAQGTALDRYSRAVRQHATEVERVHVDSIVHDSVLTALLTAARAESREQKVFAAQMASNAMRHLQEAALVSPDDGSTVRFRQLADRIVTTARQMQAPFTVRVRSLDTRVIPSAQAEALYSAAVQAMVNSVQHAGAGDVRRWLKVSGVHGGAVEIEVGDAGVGFDVEHIAEGRLGVRRSIVERTANAGGRAEVRSIEGRGTVISLLWPVFAPGSSLVPTDPAGLLGSTSSTTPTSPTSPTGPTKPTTPRDGTDA